MLQRDDLLIGRLRTRPSGSGQSHCRSAWERVLSDVDPARCVPGSSVLIVRKVSMRRQSGVARALEQHLRTLAGSAARPARGENADFAQAVLFETEAEMLAFLGLDWLSGSVNDRWWWRELLRNALPVRPGFWLDRVRILPAVAALLLRRGALTPFVQQLGPAVCVACVEALVREYNLPCSLAQIIAAPRSAATPACRVLSGVDNLQALAFDEVAPDASAIEALLAELLVAVDASPERARSSAFVEAAIAQVRTSTLSEPSSQGSASVGVDPPGNSSSLAEPAPKFFEPVGRGLSHVSTSSAAAMPARIQPDPVPSQSEIREARFDESANPATQGQQVDTAEVATNAVLPTCPPDAWSTEYGGAFYLTNVLLSMGFYADFTFTCVRPVEAPFWPVLLGLTRRLLNDTLSPNDKLADAICRWTGSDADEALRKAATPPAWLGFSDWFSWMDSLAAEIGARLRLALDADNAPEILIRRSARIFESAEAIDVELSLEQLSFEIRAAGLDRDPGWTPAAGRAIRFLYL